MAAGGCLGAELCRFGVGAALVLAARTLRERGGELVLIRPQPVVMRVLECWEPIR